MIESKFWVQAQNDTEIQNWQLQEKLIASLFKDLWLQMDGIATKYDYKKDR